MTEQNTTFPPFETYLTESNLNHLLDSRRQVDRAIKDSIVSLEFDSGVATIHAFLGSGGSKEVYDIEINGERFAVGFCGINDHPVTLRNKWLHVLHEPENTAILRELGLMVNSVTKIVNIKLNGIPFPAILMKRYQDLDFVVFDSKNKSRVTNAIITAENPADIEGFFHMLGPIYPDIVALLSHGIRLGSDSFNLCLINNNPRLFFNDLGKMIVRPINPDDKVWYARQYLSYAIDAILNSVNPTTYRNNPAIPSIEKEISLENSSFMQASVEKILSMCEQENT